MKIKVTVTSDFICPWCLIGASRLEKVIESLPASIRAEVEYLPFQLNPDMPKEGMDRKTYRSQKFGSWERSQALDAHTELAAMEDGLKFDYAAMKRTPNTFDAHRLSWFAAKSGKQAAFVRAALRAYFAGGKDIGEHTVLTDLAVAVGLDRDTVAEFLASEEGVDEVTALEAEVKRKGIRGVPHVDLHGFGFTGAPDVDELREAFFQAFEKKTGSRPNTTDEFCEEGVCDVGGVS